MAKLPVPKQRVFPSGSIKPPEYFRPPRNATREQTSWHEEQMREWLAEQLDEQKISDVEEANSSEDIFEEICIKRARAGDPEPLRQLYPQFADCIYEPKLKKGPKRPKDPQHGAPVMVAADFARRIRLLWKKQYDTHYRNKSETSAEQYALDILRRWNGIDEDELTDEEKLAARLAEDKKRAVRLAQGARVTELPVELLTEDNVKAAAKPSGPSGGRARAATR